jgi:hypothetical protein
VAVCGDEGVVIEEGVGCINAINFFGLAEAESFPGIKAPGSLKEALTAQHFVDSRNATSVIIRGVEECGVRVRNGTGLAEQIGRDGSAGFYESMTFFQ